MARDEKEDYGLTAPAVEDLGKGLDVPGALGHLLAAQLEHPVVHPDPCQLVAPSHARLRGFVLVVGEDEVIAATRRWVEQVVVAFNLCPFAKRELVKERVRFVVSKADSEPELLDELAHELALLNVQPDVETTLLIHPQLLQDFFAERR